MFLVILIVKILILSASQSFTILKKFSTSPQTHHHLQIRSAQIHPEADYDHTDYLETCHQKLQLRHNQVLTILSEFHGKGRQYPSDSKCSWNIGGSPDCIPIIHCPSMDLRPCSDDKFQIFDGGGGAIHFCGGEMDNATLSWSPRSPSIDLFVKVRVGPNPNFDRLYGGIKCVVKCGDVKGGGGSHQLPASDDILGDCECGIKSNTLSQRIVEGTDAAQFEFPWMVAIVRRGSRVSSCGGSLINNLFVLSAAHCFQKDGHHNDDTRNQEVLLHAHVLNTGEIAEVEDEREETVRRQIVQIVLHPLFDLDTMDYDVSIIQLDRPVDLKKITPICLPSMMDQRNFEAGQWTTVAGWGYRKEGHQVANTLQKLNLPIIDLTLCSKSDTQPTRRMLCAGFLEGVKDACQGDSGGPLIKWNGRKWEQVGIVSFGKGCARPNNPGFYSRVSGMMGII